MRAVARIDRTLCLGTGLCEAMADDLFLLADDGIAVVQEDRDQEDRDQEDRYQDDRPERLRAIADCCPTGAITVAEETDSTAGHESKG